MAEIILNQAEVLLGTSTAMVSTASGTSTTTNIAPYDISAFVRRVRLQRQYDLHDDTRMGHTAHSRIAGLEDWTAELEVLQEFQTCTIATNNTGGGVPTNIDKLVSSILGVRAMIAIRPVAGSRTSDNPEFQGPVMLESYSPIDGAVGDLLSMTIPFRSAGNLTRYTSTT